jgi:hypothetical protein
VNENQVRANRSLSVDTKSHCDTTMLMCDKQSSVIVYTLGRPLGASWAKRDTKRSAHNSGSPALSSPPSTSKFSFYHSFSSKAIHSLLPSLPFAPFSQLVLLIHLGFTSFHTTTPPTANMKINTLTLAIAVAASCPVVSVAQKYSCYFDATYTILDEDGKPTYPTTTEQLWAVSIVETSYNAVHGSNLAMSGINMIDFNLVPETNGEDSEEDHVNVEVHVPGKLSLRGGPELKAWRLYDGRTYNGGTITCRLCGSSLDHDHLMVVDHEQQGQVDAEGISGKDDKDGINDKIDKKADHDLWVQGWCNDLARGPYPVFSGAYGCNIKIRQCKLPKMEREDEVEGTAQERVDIDESSQ